MCVLSECLRVTKKCWYCFKTAMSYLGSISTTCNTTLRTQVELFNNFPLFLPFFSIRYKWIFSWKHCQAWSKFLISCLGCRVLVFLQYSLCQLSSFQELSGRYSVSKPLTRLVHKIQLQRFLFLFLAGFLVKGNNGTRF